MKTNCVSLAGVMMVIVGCAKTSVTPNDSRGSMAVKGEGSSAPEFRHPAEEAVAKLDQAKHELKAAESELLSAIKHIPDEPSRKAAERAYEENQHAWKRLMNTDSDLQIAASGSPAGSTSVGLIPYWTAIRYTAMQAKQYRERASWILSNWQP